MTEKLLQFIWSFGYFSKTAITTTDGEPVAILFPGTLNKNSGPDFLGARIKIGDTTLAGSVELHLQTKEWLRHGHETDPNYANVVLHVVESHTGTVNNIPVLEIGNRISTLLLDRYSLFMSNASFIPCSGSLKTIKALVWNAWKERLLIERLTRKSAAVLALFGASQNHWEQTFWRLLAKTMGGKVNGEAFEAMARSVPVKLLAKHRSSIHQLEALLLGQAGLLVGEFSDSYVQLLQREYSFLKTKYGLRPSLIAVQFLRMRPGNFPTVRLAQLAMIVHSSTHLFSTVLEADNSEALRKVFAVTANDFWHYHYTLNDASVFRKKTVGTDTVENIIINAVAPLQFAYGLYLRNEAYQDKAQRLLEGLPAEANTIISGYAALGITAETAFDSQALIELKNEYCQHKKCLNCSVGNQLLREAAAEYAVANPGGHTIV